MPLFFSGRPGRTAVLRDPAVAGSLALAQAYPDLGWDGQRALITRVTVSLRGNFQCLHSVGNQVFIYAFGDRVGEMTISGLAASGSCQSDPSHGLEDVLAWYGQNRISRRSGPVRVSLGVRTAFDGFVTGLTLDASDPNLHLVSFSAQLLLPPGVS